MKSRVLSNLAGIGSIVGGLVSFFALTISLTRWLSTGLELTLAIGSVIVSFVIGIYSMYVARATRKLPHAPRVFLSYSHDASRLATHIADRLRSEGVRVWLDTEQLRPGEDIMLEVDRAISDADVFVAIVSQSQSRYLNHELEIAKKKKKKIIPVITEYSVIHPDLQKLHYIDFSSGEEEGLEKLVKTVA